MITKPRMILILFLLSILTAGTSGAVATPTGGAPVSGGSTDQRYRATIRWTGFGIPHVLARDLGSAGFGQGWAYAHDRGCDLADQIVKVRSERARWFGRGEGDEHLASDLGYLGLGIRDRARGSLATMPKDPKDLIEGYAAGYNAYLERVGAAGFPGWCRGRPWVRPISALDLHAYQLDLAMIQSGRQLVAPIALAQPPGSTERRLAVEPGRVSQDLARLTAGSAGSAAGSNAWAIGREKSAGATSRLVGNPHFPWQGELKFWESHVTVPGVLDVYGASLGGVPGVQIGFNRHLAWTGTVAPGVRHTFYSLRLADGDPTAYLVDGRTEKMRRQTARITVKAADGSLSKVSRTLWSTRYGPVLDLSGLDPALGWTRGNALTVRDANAGNGRLVEQWLAMGRAESAAELRRSIADVQGVPWSNTIAADDRGRTLFADASATPNLSPAAIAEWQRSPLGILDGSRSANTWQREPGAREPGLIPFARQPQLVRDDYLANANVSHWITNPAAPLEGYSPLQGPERTALSPRMRQTFLIIEDPDGRYSGADRRFDRTELKNAALTDRSLTSDLLAGELRTACRGVPATTPEPTRAACAALASWDGQLALHSEGAVLWREFIDQLAGPPRPGAYAGENLFDAGVVFQHGFDPNDPLHTPRGMADDTGPALTALESAARAIRAAGLPLDASPAQVQFVWTEGPRRPVPGSAENVGLPNHVSYADGRGFVSSLEPVTPPPGDPIPGSPSLSTLGYPVNTGTSFLLAVEYGRGGPKAEAVLTYSQSMDPASPHEADQIALFSGKALRPCRFTEAEIANDPELREVRISGRR